MIFEHIIIEYREEYDELNDYNETLKREVNQKYIFLNDNNDNDNYKIVAQAISLDIRGDFGFFINRNNSDECEEYEWTGNIFNITINKREKIVKILDLTDEENHVYRVEMDEWMEALLDWKDFYLKELGFMEFGSLALNHMLGVLILTYDQMGENYCSYEMIIEAIRKCSDRYGVSKSVIYRDCRKVTGVYDIESFYEWASSILENKYININLNNYIMNRIDRYDDIRPFMNYYLGISL